MNKYRQTTTTETYTAHYNLSRTAEGPSLKGPFKTWNPQPHNLLSESETETVTKRHASHARTAQNVPSAHPVAPTFNHANHSLMPNSRTTSSALPHQRIASPALHRSDHSVPYVYPLEPPQTQQARQKQNSSMMNFIRSHSNETRMENTSSRRGDDLHRAAVTSSKQYQFSSSANQAARVPAPPVSYSSPSSTEPSPRNSSDGHQPPSNNVSDGEFHRYHHLMSSSTGSKLNADYPSRRAETASSSQRMVDKKAKDRQDMVAKVAEALSPSTRPRAPENISLGQLSLLRGDDTNAFKRIASTERTLENQHSRPQVYPVQPLPSQPQQRLPSQNPDPNNSKDFGSRSNRQQIPNVMPRVAVDPPTRPQATPVPTVPQSKPAPSSKTALPPPPAKTPVSSKTQFLAHLLPRKIQSSSSRTAANPWPFNQASATERGSSKQPPKEPPTRSSRTPISHSANTQPVIPNPTVANPVPVYPRELPQSNKTVSRNTGPPVPPKQTASNAAAERLLTEGNNARDLPPSVSKPTASRAAGNNNPGDQVAFPLPTPVPSLPSSSLWPSTQSTYLPKSNFNATQPPLQPEQNPPARLDADLQMKSPIVAQQLSVKSPPKPTPSNVFPIIDSTQAAYSATLIEQTAPRPSTTPKLPVPSADLSLSLIPVETTVDHKLHERFPIQEYQALPEPELSPLFDDRDRLALVRPRAVNPRNPPPVLTKETASAPDKDPSPDATSHKLPSTRSTTASQSQSHSGKSTPTEANKSNAPVHIQWIPPPEAETSSLSSVEEDDIVLPRFTNATSQASAAAGVWTAPQKVALRSGEMSYASQAHNVYVAPQKTSRSNPPTPTEPATLETGDSRTVEAFNGPVNVPAQTVTNAERPVAGAWTTKTIMNNSGAPSTALEIVPRASAKAFENIGPSLKSQEVGRSNGSAVGMTPGAWNTKYINKSTTIFESERTNEPLSGTTVTASGQMSSTMRQALNGNTTVGAWTTKPTQPDQQVSQPFNANTTPKQASRDTTPPSVTPKYQANPAAGSGSNTPSSSQSADHHSNTGSGTSQVARVPISGHPSTPAPNRPTLRQTPPPLSISSTTPDTDSLLTPSSLNSPRSTLLITQPPPPPAPVTIYPPQTPVDKEKSSKNRILDFFRHSKPATTNISYDVWMPPREVTKEKDRSHEERKKESPTMTSQAKATITANTNTNPNPAVVPTQPQASSRPKTPKVFSPLKLFSKRNRTMSTASIDALDGTTTTVMNSPSSSAPDIVGTPYSPPVRDALLAAQEWRDNAANQLMRNKRPHRPGVTFDCAEDIAPIHMVPSRYKLSRAYYTEEDDDL